MSGIDIELSKAKTRNTEKQDMASHILSAAHLDVVNLFPEFKDLAFIGEGANGFVFKGWVGNRLMALKVLKESMGVSDEIAFRYRVEVSAMACVRHQSIVEIYDAGVREGHFYLCSEFVDGEALDKVLLRGPMELENVERLAMNLGDALRELHQAGFVHRDIKPANIMVERNGNSKLVDFGMVARPQSGDEQADQMAGTIQYAPPEQIGLIKSGVDFRSDLYSLGAILYECVAGNSLIRGNSLAAAVDQHLKLVPPRLRDLRPSIDEGLASIIHRLIEKDPRNRFESAAHLLWELENLKRRGQPQALQRRRLFSGSRLVGRENEMRRLRAIWSRCLEGKSAGAVARGLSGHGKTRLIAEFIAGIDENPPLVFKSKFEEIDRDPISGISRGWEDFLEYLDDLPRDGQERYAELLRNALQDIPLVADQLTPKLRRWFRADGDREPANQSNVDISDDQLVAYVAEFMAKFLRQQGAPVVLWFDDIQWASKLARAIVGNLVELMKDSPCMVILSVRSEDVRTDEVMNDLKLVTGADLEVLEVGALTSSASLEIARDQFGRRPIAADAEKRIEEICSGSPYLVIQFTRSLIDAGAIYLSRGKWEVESEKMIAVPLPKSLAELVERNFQNLKPEVQDLLCVAALCGTRFRNELVANVLGISREEYSRRLRLGIRARLVEGLDTSESAFVHDKALEAATTSLSDERREQYHAKLAKVTESLDPLAMFDIADHYMKSGKHLDKARGFSACTKAGRQAVLLNSNQRAFEFFTFAYELAGMVACTPEELSKIEHWLAQVNRRLGRPDEAVSCAEKAIANCSDPIERAVIRTEIVGITVMGSLDFDKARFHLEESYKDLCERGFGSNFKMSLMCLRYFLKSLWIMIGGGQVLNDEAEIRRLRATVYLDVYCGMYHYLTGKTKRTTFYTGRLLYGALRIGPSPEAVQSLSGFLLYFGTLKKTGWTTRLANYTKKMAEEINDAFLRTSVEADYALAYAYADRLRIATSEMIRIFHGSAHTLLLEPYFRSLNVLAIQGFLCGGLEYLEPFFRRGLQLATSSNIEGRIFTLKVKLGAIKIAMSDSRLSGGYKRELLGLLRSDSRVASNPSHGTNLLFSALMGIIDADAIEDDGAELLGYFEKFRNQVGLKAKGANFYQRNLFLPVALIRLHIFEKNPNTETRVAAENAVTDLKRAAQSSELKCYYQIAYAKLLRLKGDLKRAEKILLTAERFASELEANRALLKINVELARVRTALGLRFQARANALFAHDLANREGLMAQESRIREEFSLPASREGSEYSDQSVSLKSLSSGRLADSLLKVSLVVSGTIDPIKQARLVLDEMIKLLNAERGYLFAVNRKTGSLQVQSGRDNEGMDLRSLDGFSRSFVEKVFKSGKPIVLTANEEGEFSTTESIISQGVKSVMAVPMFLRDELVGLAYFDSRIARGLFSREDFEICRGLCSHISVVQEIARIASMEAEKAAIQKDLDLTAAVQSLLLPDRTEFRIGSLDLAGNYRPSRICSGDWWWYHQTVDSKVRAYLLDVTGHGASAAMVTGVLATIVRNSLDTPVVDLLKNLDDQLFGLMRGEFLSTAVVIEISPETGDFKIWSAGAPPVFLASAGPSRRQIHFSGSLLGLRKYDFCCQEGQLQKGERLHVFSDGLYEFEVESGRELGLRRLYKKFEELVSLPGEIAAQQCIEDLEKRVLESDELDDMTLVLIDRIQR
jgi:serine phosphatase RsbU (regulator of sigma subunit)/tetratricopeptide (TPR) repeat protein